MKISFTRFIAAKAATIIKTSLALIVFLGMVEITSAQTTVTFSLLKQPCNNDGVLVATVAGATPPLTFVWYGGSTVSHISNTNSDTLQNYSGTSIYVSVSNSTVHAYGSYAGSPPFNDTISTTAAVCPALGTATVHLGGGVPPFTFKWTNTNNTVVSTSNPANLPAGSYNVVITDSTGCEVNTYGKGNSGLAGGAVYITNTSPVTFTVDTTTAKCTNGTARVVNIKGGKPPYSFLWNNGANTSSITGLSMGNYDVTVTDSLGCYNTGYADVAQSPGISANGTITNATCVQNNGSIALFTTGGKSPYTYNWSNGQNSATATSLPGATEYSVTATDVNGCEGVSFFYVTATTPITVTYSTTPSSCTAPTGTATLNITGGTLPYSVQWFTYPGQTGITATGLPPGEYSFSVTDSTGCNRTGIAYVPPVSPVTATPSETDASCTQANGSATVLLLTGQAPISYVWNTGGSTSSIDNVAAGTYSVTITDNLSCSVTKYVTVNVATPISLSLAPSTSSCLYSANGGVATSIAGGTAPYTYNWSNGQTGSNAINLLTGEYYLFVQDAAGCVQDAKTFVPYNKYNDSCYCTITGRVYLDANSNCMYDSGETLIPNIMVHCSGLGYAFTDANGVYTFLAPTGSYTLSENVEVYYPLASCQSNSISVNVTAASGCVNSNDFANIINPIHDVSISTTRLNPPILGRTYTQTVVVQNNGTATEPDIQLGYATDGQLFLTGETPSIFTQQNAATYPNWYSVITGFPSLAAGAQQAFNINYNVPYNIPLGTSVVFNDTTAYAAPIANWLNDYTPWNNVSEYQDVVVGSFDPNEKEVSPKGTGAEGIITPDDSILTYTVHFQNAGTWSAQNVVVIDTLDPNLDITTLRPGYSNHTYTTRVSNSGAAIFTFSNINLPDSIGQPVTSIGLLMYSAHLKRGLTGGTQIKSPASVYFDFNAPVKTNAALNTLNVATSVKNIARNQMEMSLYPNPAASSVYITLNAVTTDENSTLRFYNVLGQLVKSESVSLVKGKNLLTESLSALPTGLYFVEVTEGSETAMQKLNVVR